MQCSTKIDEELDGNVYAVLTIYIERICRIYKILYICLECLDVVG